MTTTASHERPLRRWPAMGLVAAVVGAALCAVFGWQAPELLWKAYLLALLICWPVAMGGLGMLALGNLTGGAWAAAVRPFHLAATATLLPLALLFIPLAFGLEHIYSWAHASSHDAPEFSPSKATWLSPPFFLARAAAYFVVWLLVAWWVAGVSRLDRPPASRPAMRRAGAVSLVLLASTAAFAAFDWGMSLEPHWYSSIYGAILTAGGVVAAHALALVCLSRFTPPLRSELYILRPHAGQSEVRQFAELLNDLGNLLLAFIMVWTYFSFSQFFLMWSANLPSEIVWYQRRLSNGWQYAALAMVGICFAAPFLLLLSRDMKRRHVRLAAVASLLIFGYLLNMYWTIVPAFGSATVESHLVNVGAVIGVGGLWFAVYAWRIARLGVRRSRAHDATE